MGAALFPVVWVLFVGAALWLGLFRRPRDARRHLERWAAREQQDLLEARPAFVWRGPFMWVSSNSQVVFRVRVRSGDGTVRTGWVRVGRFWDVITVADVVDARLDEAIPA